MKKSERCLVYAHSVAPGDHHVTLVTRFLAHFHAFLADFSLLFDEKSIICLSFVRTYTYSQLWASRIRVCVCGCTLTAENDGRCCSHDSKEWSVNWFYHCVCHFLFVLCGLSFAFFKNELLAGVLFACGWLWLANESLLVFLL